MRVLHVVKTADGARWAAWQSAVLARHGVEVHVVLPSDHGDAVELWEQAGATLHVANWSLPLREPWTWPQRAREIRALVDSVAPDIVHSHFVTTTLAVRRALGDQRRVPTVFQVPGPLHLEHSVYRAAELKSARASDYWIASSRYIARRYWRSGVSLERVFLSYYGSPLSPCPNTDARQTVRQQFDISPDQFVVGSISYMYPPKYYLGQTSGLKRHEDIIDAIGIASREHPDLIGLVIGGEWGGGSNYFSRLCERAEAVAPGRIRLPGPVHFGNAASMWSLFDCVLHLPMSENCGGVVEPLAAHVPTIASRVGGLPEVVFDGITGSLVPVKSPADAARAIERVRSSPAQAHGEARRGGDLVREMFRVERTGAEVAQIYRHILDPTFPPPEMFDSLTYARSLAGTADV